MKRKKPRRLCIIPNFKALHRAVEENRRRSCNQTTLSLKTIIWYKQSIYVAFSSKNHKKAKIYKILIKDIREK